VILSWSVQPGRALMISEVMYHPIEDAATGDETLEFIELYNNRAVSEELGKWAFTNGIEYAFEPNTLLGPKKYLVIAHARRRGALRYHGRPPHTVHQQPASGWSCPMPTARS
jgi:hypothetical protein